MYIAITSCLVLSGEHILTSSSDTSFGSKVKITCEKGYKLVGSTDTVVCQTNGEWSPATPNCTVDDKNKPAGGSSGIIICYVMHVYI